MCGIFGLVTVAGHRDDMEITLRRAARSMAHRGPDGEGIWWDDKAGLAHRRLSIIDVEGGRQPMAFLGDRFHICFNGEIYNFRDLRRELEALGHHFRTRSDTEVILAAYAQWGREAPSRLRGIFAFGIWDGEERRLFLARDHFGVKPLLFASGEGWIAFSSELKALLGVAGVSTRVSREGAWEYLAAGYVLGSRTIVADVEKVPAGSWLEWRDGNLTTGEYWDPAEALDEGHGSEASEQALVDEYDEKLRRAVESQLIADVPVGAFLSGGLDSSSVVYHVRRLIGPSVKTFSMGFEEASYNELRYARRAADWLGTDHRSRIAGRGIEDYLHSLASLFDEPLGDTSLVPTHLVATLAREDVKVVLSGDGADECLAGYDTYIADRLQRLYSRLPAFLHDHVLGPVSLLIPPSRRKVSLNYKLRQFVSQARKPFAEAHFGWRGLFDEEQCRRLLHSDLPCNPGLDAVQRHFARVAKHHWLVQCLYVDVKTWLADDILTKVDRATMAVGLEARVPFLDLDLYEFTARLPTGLKLRGLTRKAVLRRAMQGRLPKEILLRRKSGFNSPVSDWLRGPLRAMGEELFKCQSSDLDLDRPLIRKLWSDHLSGAGDHGFKLWALLMLLLWEREVLHRVAIDAHSAVPAL